MSEDDLLLFGFDFHYHLSTTFHRSKTGNDRRESPAAKDELKWGQSFKIRSYSIMRPNPELEQFIVPTICQGAVAKAHTNRQVRPRRFEME